MSDDESEGAVWYMSLTEAEQDEMSRDLGVWYRKLEARFRPDRFAMMAEADELAYSFETEAQLPLQ